ncbi:MAG: hypothetical protein K6D97_05255 [Clostridia bacterium]|nr:hypothetical protein [Clostridia bacterium]
MKEEELIKKIERLENNCITTAKTENEELKKENNEIEANLLDEKLVSYESEIEKKQNIEFGKLLRDYNKNIFVYNMESKKKITQFKDTLTLNIHKTLIERFFEYTESDDYINYLKNNIRQVLERVKKTEDCKIFVTKRDVARYKDELMREFGVEVDEISDENIGGCMLVNIKEKISIDNTLKNNIFECVKNISFK